MTLKNEDIGSKRNNVNLAGEDENVANFIKRFTLFVTNKVNLTRGAQRLTGENLKLVWAEFSTLS